MDSLLYTLPSYCVFWDSVLKHLHVVSDWQWVSMTKEDLESSSAEEELDDAEEANGEDKPLPMDRIRPPPAAKPSEPKRTSAWRIVSESYCNVQ